MSFKIDDKIWVPQTTNEHAVAWMEGINALLEANDIRDKDGNIIKLSQNFANALYLQILAGANRLADNDQKLQQAINSFNIELCDDQQIENLLPIAAITRNPGSYSTLVLTCTASADGICTIPAGTKAPYGDVNFVVKNTAIIQAGETQNVNTVCDTIGVYAVLSGEVTSFDTQIPNLENVINNVSSVPGNAAETTASLRRRILKGQTVPYSIDGVKLALEELTGINHARVYLNVDPDADLTLPGGIVVSPRTAYIVINGSSDQLAETYAKYMSAQTQNAPGASPTGSYTTVDVYVTAGEADATVPAGTTFSFDGVTFANDTDTTVLAGTTEMILFTATEVGAVVIPSGSISVSSFQTPIENIVNVSNDNSVPGIDKTAYEQDYETASGQIIPIKYDVASNQTVFIKVVLAAGDNNDSPQIRNQIKRDLIASSASWVIGESITSLITGAIFKDCTYTTVAYTQVSTDGSNWSNYVTVAANAIPRISDSTIVVDNL
ncbi:MAG: hypothetical protein IKY09_07645 [Methanocorpusculum sp.]|nr:hypothetical protein [Methanocorpusculum sp.]MBR5450185.1 hypothetical protein [Methanocorpusculum sp.]